MRAVVASQVVAGDSTSQKEPAGCSRRIRNPQAGRAKSGGLLGAHSRKKHFISLVLTNKLILLTYGKFPPLTKGPRTGSGSQKDPGGGGRW
jgi:hypothetical protein